jgi:hypothetical protein
MSNWHDDLLKKAKELNITQEEKNVSSRVNIRNNSGDSSRGSGSIRLPVSNGKVSEINKDVKLTLKGGIRNFMINAKGAFSDLDKLIAEAAKVTTMAAATILILQGIRVAVKVILTARTNTVKIMDKLGIPRQTKETPGTPITAPVEETED